MPSFLTALAGGMLIGIATALLLLVNGRVAGISGIVDGAFRLPREKEWGWKALFLGGLLVGGIGARLLAPHAIGPVAAPAPVLLIAGGLVGAGTRMAGGCTSGHGVCGLARLSIRSLAATGIFMGVAMAVVYAIRHGSPGPAW